MCSSVQLSNGTKNARPASMPSPAPAQQPPPVHRDGAAAPPPTGASDHHRPYGGNAQQRQHRRPRRRPVHPARPRRPATGHVRRPSHARGAAHRQCRSRRTRRRPNEATPEATGRDTNRGAAATAPRCSQALPGRCGRRVAPRPSDRPDADWLPPSGRCLLAARPPCPYTGRRDRFSVPPRRPPSAGPGRRDSNDAALGQRTKGRSEQQPRPVVGLKDGTRCPRGAVNRFGKSLDTVRRVAPGVSPPATPLPGPGPAQQGRAASGCSTGQQPRRRQHVVDVDRPVRGRPRHRPAAGVVGQDRAPGPPRVRRGAWRSTPPEPTTSRTSRRSRAGATGVAAACRRAATVTASAARRRSSRPGPPASPARYAGTAARRPRPPRRRLRLGRVEQPLGERRRDHARRAPAHAQVPLDGAGPPQRPGDLAAQAAPRRPAPAPSTRRWSRPPRRPPTRSARRAGVGQQLHPGQHRVRGGRPRPATANRGPRDSRLPPITCRRNTSRIAARAGSGSSSPIRGSTLAVAVTGTPRSGSSRRHLVAGLDVAGHHDRHPQPRAGQPARRCAPAPRALPPSVPPTSRTTSGRPRAARHRAPVQRARRPRAPPGHRRTARPGGRPRR